MKTCVKFLILLVTVVMAPLSLGQAYRFGTLAGGPPTVGARDGIGTAATFRGPLQIAADLNGNLYVTDFTPVIRRISPQGTNWVVSTIAGNMAASGTNDGQGLAARFGYLIRLACDSQGSVFVADGNTVRKLSFSSSNWTVATIAGAPQQPGSNDGRTNEARFNLIRGIAVDLSGNVFVSDNRTVRRIGNDGLVTTLAGLSGFSGVVDGLGPQARFVDPSGIALDVSGNIYVCDGSNTVRKVTASGVVTTIAGSPSVGGFADGIAGAARFNSPTGVSTDAAGNIWIADSGNHVIRRISPVGVVVTIAGVAADPGFADGAGTTPRFWSPQSVAADGRGNMYVADYLNNVVRQIVSQSEVKTIAGMVSRTEDGTGTNAGFGLPKEVAVSASGKVFIIDSLFGTLRAVGPDGRTTTIAGYARHKETIDGTGANARFNVPDALTVDANEVLYVSEANTIRKVSPLGVVTTLAGSAGQSGSLDGFGTNSRFASPKGLAVDAGGAVYVADAVNRTIRQVSPIGEVTTFAGAAGQAGTNDGVGLIARFIFPSALGMDQGGNLYVSDNLGTVLRKISPNGVVSTYAGVPNSKVAIDGKLSDARFAGISAIAPDQTGNVFLLDGNAVRKVSVTGTVSTLAGDFGEAGFANGLGPMVRFNEPVGLALYPNGTLYVADYLNSMVRFGVPESNGLLGLQIRRIGTQGLLSWPASLTNAVLETSKGLSAGTAWTQISNGPTVFGDSFLFISNMESSNAFFRLKKP